MATYYSPEQQWANVLEWTAALRSGSYPQAIGLLHNQSGYCVLGVGCAVASRHIPITVCFRETPEGWMFGYKDDAQHPEFAAVPEAVREFFGLAACNGEFGSEAQKASDDGELYSLDSLNDAGMPFDKLADLIESRPPWLFESDFEIAEEIKDIDVTVYPDVEPADLLEPMDVK